MRFLVRQDIGRAGAWRRAVGEYPHSAPGIVRELLVSRSVVCDALEAHPAWIDEPGPLLLEDPNA